MQANPCVRLPAFPAYAESVRGGSENTRFSYQGYISPRTLAVIAIENVRLFDEVQARTRELTQSVEELRALGKVSQAVNSTLDLETVLQTITSRAVQLSGTEAGTIYVYDERHKQFRMSANYGMSDELITAVKDLRLGISDAVREVTESGAPSQAADLRNEPPSVANDLMLRAGFRARLVVPLLRSGEVVGALVVRLRQPGAFAESTVDLLQTFAAQSVLAIQNARLFSEIEEKSRQLAERASTRHVPLKGQLVTRVTRYTPASACGRVGNWHFTSAANSLNSRQLSGYCGNTRTVGFRRLRRV
jgi:transcriptional regulator with GAF, ATPase, and Fis domain